VLRFVKRTKVHAILTHDYNHFLLITAKEGNVFTYSVANLEAKAQHENVGT
jgi:hypothetical protein